MIKVTILFLIFILSSCSKNMVKNSKVQGDVIEKIMSKNQVVREEYAPHFIIKELSDGSYLACNLLNNWAYFSCSRRNINKYIREYMIAVVHCPDPRGSPLRNAKKIIRERKSLIRELCHHLAISPNTDLSYEQINAIDEVIKKKGAKEVYSKYYTQLGVFLGEILNKKMNGNWFVKESTHAALFISSKEPFIKIGKIEYSPWSRLGRYYEEDTGNFSLYLSITTITEGLKVYQQDFNQN
jgi:hypothetical protein